MEVLNIVDTEEVAFELTGALNPGILRAGGNDFLYVVMPMNT
jgi:DNA polymerase III sliding clamp (beta) subunit (PCNA family)